MSEQDDPRYQPSSSAFHERFIARIRTLYHQLTLSEISGSIGDLGTFVPLVIALSKQSCIDLCPTLFWAGFSNVITGWAWDVPMCVQPMKSIAAVALAHNLARQQVTTAGIWMGIFMIFLSVTDGIEMINWLIPFPVVSGIQMGVGINLSIRGIKLIQNLAWMPSSFRSSDDTDDDNDAGGSTDGLDCRLLSVVVALLCLYWLREPTPPSTTNTLIGTNDNNDETATITTATCRNNNENDDDTDQPTASRTPHENSTAAAAAAAATTTTRPPAGPPPPTPVGLYLFGLGMILALIHLVLFPTATNNQDDEDSSPSSSSSWFGNREPILQWALLGVTGNDWKQGLLLGAVPQLPLTTLNSVVSVCCLAHTLYPEKRRKQPQRRRQQQENNTNNKTNANTDEGDDEFNAATTTTTTTEDAVVSRREVSFSVGVMNLLLCPLGAMPCCHGAGGLAGQHKFGARHGASVVFLGLNKMLVSIVLGGTLLHVLEALPNSILGLMLVVCGHELALMGWTVLVVNCSSSSSSSSSSTGTTTATETASPEQRQRRQQEGNHEDQDGATGATTTTASGIPLTMKKGAVVALITVIVDVGLHKTHYAALSGWAAYMIYGDGIQDYMNQWNSRRISTQAGAEYSPIVAYTTNDDVDDADEDPLRHPA